MRIVGLLVLGASLCASAQTPQELLSVAQRVFQNPAGYEFKGTVSMQPVGSSWRVTMPITVAAAPAPLENPNAPVSPGTRVGGDVRFAKIGTGNDEKPLSFVVGPVVSDWREFAENTTRIREIGRETLPLNGAPVDCRVLDVEYAPTAENAPPGPVKYSICSDKHLLLKKVVSYSMGRRTTDRTALWTITFDTAQFHRPAPEWLIRLKNQPTLLTRTEWLGRIAPGFRLSALDDQQIDLRSLRGKIVLLEFWSTACAPCVREMPSIEKFAEEHKADLTLWGISEDQPERDKKWLTLHRQTFPTLSDSDFVVSDLYKVHGIPAVVLIDRKGRIRNYWEREVPIPSLERALEKLSAPR